MADAAHLPGGPASAIFTFTSTAGSDGINWNTSNTNNLVSEFIKNGTISNYSGALTQAAFLSSQMSSTGNLASYFEIVGTYSGTGVTGTISSDDGSSVYAGNQMTNPGGLVQEVSNPNPQVDTTFGFTLPNAGPGSPFTVDYVEANGAPSVLDFNVSAAPEPSTWALTLLGVFGIGAMMRRGRRSGSLARA